MKFLVTGRFKESYYALPAGKRLQLMTQTYAYIDKHLKTGRCREMFMTADLNGNVSIWDIESSEEATRFMIENPFFTFQDIEVQPLIETDAAKKAVTDYVNKLIKSVKKEKLAPPEKTVDLSAKGGQRRRTPTVHKDMEIGR